MALIMTRVDPADVNSVGDTAVLVTGTELDTVVEFYVRFPGSAINTPVRGWQIISPTLISVVVAGGSQLGQGHFVALNAASNVANSPPIYFGGGMADPRPPLISSMSPASARFDRATLIDLWGDFSAVNDVWVWGPGRPPSPVSSVPFFIYARDHMAFISPVVEAPTAATVAVLRSANLGQAERPLPLFGDPPVPDRPPRPHQSRSVWLELAGRTLPLEDDDKGYWCSELDLGSPVVREVVDNRPDAMGVIDRTRYWGGRIVSATIDTYFGGGAVIDEVAASFAPFMVPLSRPVLHFIGDRAGGERIMELRGMEMNAPMHGLEHRSIHLQWMAADPVLRGAEEKMVIAWSGSSTVAGRIYPLTFNRVYPAGGGSSQQGTIRADGDVPVQPLLRLYGPITWPHINLVTEIAGVVTNRFAIQLKPVFSLTAGEYVDIDTRLRTAFLMGDPDRSVLQYFEWSITSWPVLPVLPGTTTLSLGGSSTTGVTQVQAIWREGFLA